MNDIKFSLIAPSIRPQLWKTFCNSLSNTKINYEVIFIGPLPPICELPSSFRWIKSSTKPSQCTHIGFMEAKGEFISLTADDAQYFSPNSSGALDNMMKFIEKFPEHPTYVKNNIAYGFRMFEDTSCIESSLTHFLIEDKKDGITNPLLYPFFVIRKSSYIELKGYDNRFVCGQAENDFLLRVVRDYGHTKNSLCPLAMVWANHDAGHNNISKFREYHSFETELLKKLWLDANGQYHIQNNERLIPYINDDSLLTTSQGNKGEWI
jgi:hypothetical protein